MGAAGELVKCLDWLQCVSPYKVKCHSELENIDHKVFGSNNMDDFWDMTKMLKPGSNDLVFCSALQFSACS